MPPLTFDALQLYATVFLGMGGILLGLAGLLFRLPLPQPRWVRAGLVLGLLAAFSAGVAALCESPLAWLPLAALVGSWVVYRIARSTWVARAGRRLCHLAATAEARWGSVLVGSLVVTALLLLRLDGAMVADELPLTPHEQQPEVARNIKPVSFSPLMTDRGRVVPVYVNEVDQTNPTLAEEKLIAQYHLEGKLIRTGPADSKCDCHGWTFAEGNYWLAGKDMEIVLEDNGYKPVSQPKPGDLVIYRSESDGMIVHSGIVRMVGAPGESILVESKWGDLSRFLHPVEMPMYNAHHTFYHTDRVGGHSLRTQVL
jgi:hypothetical protein